MYRYCAGKLMCIIFDVLNNPSRYIVRYYDSACFTDQESEVRKSCPNSCDYKTPIPSKLQDLRLSFKWVMWRGTQLLSSAACAGPGTLLDALLSPVSLNLTAWQNGHYHYHLHFFSQGAEPSLPLFPAT